VFTLIWANVAPIKIRKTKIELIGDWFRIEVLIPKNTQIGVKTRKEGRIV
jgi:hypothetical protein